MTPGFYLRYATRELRGAFGRLVFFTLCLSVGVAAVVAVAGLSDSMDETLRAEARKLLAADLAVEGRRPLPEELYVEIERMPGASWTVIKELPSMVASPGDGEGAARSVLAELKAIDGAYPFYGDLELDPPERLDQLIDRQHVVVAPALLERLDVAVGGTLKIGEAGFTIAGLVRREPDSLGMSFTLGPRVLMSAAGLERSGLERFGSRVLHRALIRMPEGSSRQETVATAERLRRSLPDASYLNIETYAEAQPSVRRSLRRAENFLGVIALLSLLIGGIGVAQAVRAWLAGRMDAIAILRSLGMRPREVLVLYLGQTVVLGLLGSLLGVATGIAIVAVVPLVAGDLLPVLPVQALRPLAAFRGLALGVGVALLFSLPALLAVRRVPPARVLRADAEPLPPSRPAWWGTTSLLFAGICGMAILQSGSITRGLQFAAGMLVAAGVLALAAILLSRFVGRAPRSISRIWVRHGLAALSRPGAGTLGALVALGLGVLVVLSMYLVQSGLGRQLEADLPDNSPTAFLIDVQPSQWPRLRELLAAEGALHVDSVPVVMARLKSIDGRTVDDLVEELDASQAEQGRRRWVLTREQRLTYMKDLPSDNVVVRGALWSEPDRPEISIERGFAEDLPVDVGSVLTFDIQGVPIDLYVSSIRSVEWARFGINFFLVVEPGVLDDAPQTRVVAARLPVRGEQRVQDRLAASFPNVTLLDIRAILEKVAAIVARIGLGIRLLGGFTVLAGIAILAGAVSAGAVRRSREVALLKTLGMTRRGVIAVFGVEYALLGLVAGLIGSAGAGLLAWAILTRGMEIVWRFDPFAHTAAVAGSVLLTIVAGIATSARALTRRPVEVLRTQ
jgi:putative ABC transport system permease protein